MRAPWYTSKADAREVTLVPVTAPPPYGCPTAPLTANRSRTQLRREHAHSPHLREVQRSEVARQHGSRWPGQTAREANGLTERLELDLESRDRAGLCTPSKEQRGARVSVYVCSGLANSAAAFPHCCLLVRVCLLTCMTSRYGSVIMTRRLSSTTSVCQRRRTRAAARRMRRSHTALSSTRKARTASTGASRSHWPRNLAAIATTSDGTHIAASASAADAAAVAASPPAAVAPCCWTS
jgi:hypothetical protein